VNPFIGWGLALIATALAWVEYGWRGVVLALSVIVFWLLLQFSRAIRVMKNASGAPVGHIGSAVMLNAQLKAGMTLLQIIGQTRSLGRRIGAAGLEPEQWQWADDGGVSLTLELHGGKLRSWRLERPDLTSPDRGR
jgi:hypothetical protein